jgi:signal peptide peptidase SppA
MTTYTLPPDLATTAECFRAHCGLWAIEPYWMTQGLQALQQGLWTVQEPLKAAVTDRPTYPVTEDGVAIVRITGPLTKGFSKFGGTSTIQTRRALRHAAQDETIRSVLLAVDSPGGQVDGVADLAAEVQRTRLSKPVVAYVEDLGASAAYWVASQAQRLTGNRTAEVGSIGVIAVLEDLSQMAAQQGVAMHVITTSPYKAVGVPGAPVLPEHLAYLQDLVQTMGGFFFEAVQSGRQLSAARLAAVTDGRVFVGQDAVRLGLLDGIETFDEALARAARMRRPSARTHAQTARLAAISGAERTTP